MSITKNMTNLVAMLSTGKGTWTEVNKIIKAENWEKIFLITNQFGKENFNPPSNAEIVVIKESSEDQMSEQIHSYLKHKIGFNEIALNISSGNGKEHMALISAILKCGVGIRLVSLKEEKILEL